MDITVDNDLRVFASRSRCKNSVGLNAVGAAGSAAAYGLFRWDWRLGRGGGAQVEASGRRRAIAAFETAGAGRQPSFRAHKPEDWRRRSKCVRGMPDPCKDDLELVSGEGVGGSWSLGPLRGNLADKHLRQQGQTRGLSGFSGSADGSAASALIWACSGVA